MSLEAQIGIAAAEEYGAKYDEAVKVVFMFPEIIAPVLKEVVPEYKDCTVEEVISCIDSRSIVSDPVDSASAMAGRLPTEMNSIGEKLIRYDSHFIAVNPKLSGEIKFFLHIDLEVNNDYKPSNPSYPIIKRAVYYGAREISSQLGVLTEETNYSKLEKVYSIWICNENIPEKLQNTVTSYSMSKKDEIGVTDESASDYDLMTIIIIRRGKKNDEHAVFDYLNGVFTSNMEKICDYVDITGNEEIVKGVNSMSGLGLSIYKQGGQEMVISLIKKGLLQLADGAREVNMTEAELAALIAEGNHSDQAREANQCF